MRILLILILALSMPALAHGKPDAFWTLDNDPYYHADAGCDGGDKVPISEKAALVFEKTPCPVCVQNTAPFYTGAQLPDWTDSYGLWEPGFQPELQAATPDWYQQAGAQVNEAFDRIHAEVYDRTLEDYVLTEPYPEDYGGRYLNKSGILTFVMVNPTPDRIQQFTERYGAGIWIVPGKTSYNQLRSAQKTLWDDLEAWIDAHPEFHVRLTSIGIDVIQNCLMVGLDGPDWEEAAQQLPVPVYVLFEYAQPAVTTGF